jgi:hypothetical protein
VIIKEALGVPSQRYHCVGTSVGSRMTPEDAPDTGRSAAGNIVKPIVESSSGCCRFRSDPMPTVVLLLSCRRHCREGATAKGRWTLS